MAKKTIDQILIRITLSKSAYSLLISKKEKHIPDW